MGSTGEFTEVASAKRAVRGVLSELAYESVEGRRADVMVTVGIGLSLADISFELCGDDVRGACRCRRKDLVMEQQAASVRPASRSTSW